MAPREVDPLLIKQGSSSVSSTTDHHCLPQPSASARHGHSRLIQGLLAALALCAVVLGLVVWKDQTSNRASGGGEVDMGDAALEHGMVTISEDGDYQVHYSNSTTTTTTTSTFGDLAAIMLPPWYEASLLVIRHVLTPGMDPSDPNLKYARKVLLHTRDLLDVFSPVYPNPASRRQALSWAHVRAYFKIGYERVGYFHDLESSGVLYDKSLWDDRRQSVLDWKNEFAAFRQQHNVREYLVTEISLEGCYDHKESHLFWGELGVLQSLPRMMGNKLNEVKKPKKHHKKKGIPTRGTVNPPLPVLLDDTTELKLPCASDLATPSLASLATVQLTHALHYLQLVLPYRTVLTVEQQEEYHNLRKEMRVFLDEYKLFDDFLLDATAADVKESMEILAEAVQRIGVFHDQWTAYDMYETQGKHEKEQIELAHDINQGWDDFKVWATTPTHKTFDMKEEGKLEGALHLLLEALEAEL